MPLRWRVNNKFWLFYHLFIYKNSLYVANATIEMPMNSFRNVHLKFPKRHLRNPYIPQIHGKFCTVKSISLFRSFDLSLGFDLFFFCSSRFCLHRRIVNLDKLLSRMNIHICIQTQTFTKLHSRWKKGGILVTFTWNIHTHTHTRRYKCINSSALWNFPCANIAFSAQCAPTNAIYQLHTDIQICIVSSSSIRFNVEIIIAHTWR